jgi:hypothetical protein
MRLGLSQQVLVLPLQRGARKCVCEVLKYAGLASDATSRQRLGDLQTLRNYKPRNKG